MWTKRKLNRRCFIRNAALAGLACGALPYAQSNPYSNSPKLKISGGLWWCDAAEFRTMGDKGMGEELDAQRAVGFDLLWLVNAPALLEETQFSLTDLLNLCATRKIQVILDTGSTSQWYGKMDHEGELSACGANVKSLGERFAGHPAFYAWYIPHEIYMAFDRMDAYIQVLYPKLVERCKRAANLPVAVSPFFILDRTKVFGDFRFNEPDEYQAYWTKLIAKSGLDIVMLQDSGEHFSYVTNEQRRPFFEAMSQACRKGGARLWGNVEVAEMDCPSIEEYERRYGRVHHSLAKGIPWRPVPLERLKEKVALAAEYSERLVSWGYKEYCRPHLGPSAKAWYKAYQSYVRGRT